MSRWLLLKRALYLVQRARRKREAAEAAMVAAEAACKELFPYFPNLEPEQGPWGPRV